MAKSGVQTRKKWQEFLRSFFTTEGKEENIEVNGFVLHRFYNVRSKEWLVDLYTKESWDSMKSARHKMYKQNPTFFKK